MDYSDLIATAQRHVPPSLWQHAYRLYAASAMLRGGARALASNEALRNRFRGQRAFVVGNGPSLNRHDLSLLRNEHLFTVNAFFEHAQRLGLTPRCHAFLDPAYFDQDTAAIESFAARRSAETLCFVPWRYRQVAHRYIPDAFCLLAAGTPETNPNLDITRPIPELRTVTLAALILALHFGCDPIYLIGCDMDFLSKVVGVDPLRVSQSHFYDETKQDVVEIKGFDYGCFCHAMYTMFEGFKSIKARVNGKQRIYNAGAGGWLDVFPRVDYASLFR